MTAGRLRVGVSGWGIASRYSSEIPSGGSHLERYSRIFAAAEITTSFYRPHQLRTYQRWARSVGPEFRFSVKTPRALTHEGALVADSAVLERFVFEVEGLADKLRVLLVQLPPSLEFVPADSARFFKQLRQRIKSTVAIVCEPRHQSWNCAAAEILFKEQGIARAAADPARWTQDALPGGDPRLAYFRLHGSPRTYFSDYEPQRLAELAHQLHAAMQTSEEVWCIFDNTAHGHAIGNALAVRRMLGT